MRSRTEAATRAYPYFHEDKTPPELMDMMRRSLRAADEVMFSEEALAKATEAARESMWSRPANGGPGSYPTHLSRQDYATITLAVIASLKTGT
jgi:hypothetical protein